MDTKKIKMKGGIPIYPGGYSCVFKPQLNCKTHNKTKKNNKRITKSTNQQGISKLLFKKYADFEMHNIQKFYHALKKIPNSHKYFLFTKTKSCSPAKIGSQDLKGFNKMCTNFTSHNIFESNINKKKNIQNLRLINMPNAGISINEWLFLTNKNNIKPLTISRLKIFNKIVSNLILHAIVPMNQQGVIHNDIKEDNILIKSTSPTIIDWGISGISTHDNPIPEIIMNRYISISNPFSSILFTTEFSKNYTEFLKQNNIVNLNHIHNMHNDPLLFKKIREFSLQQYLKNKEYGHYSYIRTFFINIFKYFSSLNLNHTSSFHLDIIANSPDDLYYTFASNYISNVLIHFTEFDERDGVVRFNYIKYFTNVYIFNCDIWGILFCYSIFFSFQDNHSYNKYIDIPEIVYSSFLSSILSIYMKQVMINGHEKIKVSKLLKSIKKLLS
jgi:tRNA A-37 threonylcarbamoyl transferase component Bud32